MTSLHLPLAPNLKEDQARILGILAKMESLGGSAAYAQNPAAFREITVLLEPYSLNTYNVISGTLKEENGPTSKLLKAKLAHSEDDIQLDASVTKDPQSAQQDRVLEVLKGVEQLGGSAGFEEYRERESTIATATPTPTRTLAARATGGDWTNCYASGWIASGLVATSITIYADNHTGSGWSWGAGLGVSNLQGNLAYKSWDKLCSAVNTFGVVSVAAGTAIQFYVGDEYVAQFTGANLGAVVAAGVSGKLTWKKKN